MPIDNPFSDRYTAAFIPPEAEAQQIEEYARSQHFDRFNLTHNAEGQSVYLYRLGTDPQTQQKRNAHVTIAQFKFNIEDKAKREEEFIRRVILPLRAKAKAAGEITAQFGGVDQYPIPANSGNYDPVVPNRTTWIDRNIVRTDELMSLANSVFDLLSKIPTLYRDPKSGAFTFNGIYNKYRPHFTFMRAQLPEDKDAIAMPHYNGSMSFKFKGIAVGESEPSGELVNVWGYIDPQGNYHAVNREIDFAPYETYSYKAREYGEWAYESMPSMSSLPGYSTFTSNLPSFESIRNKVSDAFASVTNSNVEKPKGP